MNTTSTTTTTTTTNDAPLHITGVNHIALRVRDVEVTAEFYKRVLGFTEDVERFGRGVLAFLRAPLSDNHHDLALLQIGDGAADNSPRSVGLFHFALEVEQIEDLLAAQARLEQEGCFQGASDHGATKAIYGADPDGNTFELTWIIPRAEWGEWETVAPIKKPIDLYDEVTRRHGQRPVAA
jgi:catechol-2,3-dioxygenase